MPSLLSRNKTLVIAFKNCAKASIKVSGNNEFCLISLLCFYFILQDDFVLFILQDWKCIQQRENCPYLELFCSAFSRIRTEYGEILRISLYSVRMQENADQNNSDAGTFYAVFNCKFSFMLYKLQCQIS